jgi:protein MpaA
VNEVVLGASRRGLPIVAHESGTDGGLLVFGAIHGDEPASATLCQVFLHSLVASGPAPLAILPVANPDGLRRKQKDNSAGVDLNRNFAARSWQLGTPVGYDPGPRPLSEPESAVLDGWVRQRRPRVIVAVHQPFACVNWDGPAERVAEAMSRCTGLPTQASIGYPTPGSFGAWAGVDLGIAVVTLELAAVVDDAAMQAAVSSLYAAWELSA